MGAQKTTHVRSADFSRTFPVAYLFSFWPRSSLGAWQASVSLLALLARRSDETNQTRMTLGKKKEEDHMQRFQDEMNTDRIPQQMDSRQTASLRLELVGSKGNN